MLPSVKSEVRSPYFCNHLQAGDVIISLSSSISWVSLLKAFVKFKNLIRFHHQVFIICKNGQSLKMLIEVIRQKIVSNVILVFLYHLKPRIFFVGQPWWPTESVPLFQNIRIRPGMPISSLLKFFVFLLFSDQTLSTFFSAVWKTYMSL